MQPLLFSLLVAFSTPICQAAPWQSEIQPKSSGSFPSLAPSTVEYRVSWNGLLDAGSIRLDFAPKAHAKPDSYVVNSTSRSLGPAASLFPYESSFWSEIDPSKLTAQRFFATEKGRGKTVESKTTFSTSQANYSESKRDTTKGSVKTRVRSFAHAPVHDLFSAMLFVRSQNLHKGDNIALVAQPFATPYLIRIHVVDHGQHQNQAAIQLRLTMNKINRDTLQLEPYKKMNREAYLWLSNDKHRIPLEFRASIFIGDIRATLKSKS